MLLVQYQYYSILGQYVCLDCTYTAAPVPLGKKIKVLLLMHWAVSKRSYGSLNIIIVITFQYNIRSYPTTIFYNHTVPHQFHGHHKASAIVEFLEVCLFYSVITLYCHITAERLSLMPIQLCLQLHLDGHWVFESRLKGYTFKFVLTSPDLFWMVIGPYCQG